MMELARDATAEADYKCRVPNNGDKRVFCTVSVSVPSAHCPGKIDRSAFSERLILLRYKTAWAWMKWI